MSNQKSERKIFGRSIVSGLMLVVAAALTLEATNIVQSYFSQKGIKEEASMRALSEMDGARSEIMDIVDQVETALRNSVWIAQWCLQMPDSLKRIPERLVQDNPVIAGSTMAIVPGYYKKKLLLAPYCYRDDRTGALHTVSLATEEYDYPSQEWFTEPLRLQSDFWSEPYFDEGGGNILMTTYSLPIKDRSGNIAAILTADISLDWLETIVWNMETYSNSVNKIVSRNGNLLVSTGEMPSAREKCQIYSATVDRTGWAMTITLPEKELYSQIRKVSIIVSLLQLLGLAMIMIILWAVARGQMRYQKLNKQKEVMQNELKIGHDIQMSMVPKTFPPFPDRHDLDFAAYMIPAKDVGGDLYDYYIRDEKLFFCIGDVSGKGVPASLVMAVTRSLFRAFSGREESPSRIVEAMNDSMSETNENNMFVTFFCGVIDLANGHMRYCNAGHNPPLLLTNSISKMQVMPNIPLGVMQGMEFQEQEIDLEYDDAIFLYTDGLTEAENAVAEQFGEERMFNVLHSRRSSIEHLKAMHEAVESFVGGAPQSDDLTMLFIHYLPDREEDGEAMHITMHNDINEVSRLEGIVESLAAKVNIDASMATSLNLALEEAVTNVILYAYPKGSDGLVYLDAIAKEGIVKFILTDSGIPFDPTAAPEADTTLSVEDRPIGGLGIFLVRQIMDKVSYHRRGDNNVLIMTKKI